MQAGSLPRPVPLPISPHLRQSHVLKMINDEGQEINRQAWPPRNTGGARRPNDYLTQIAKDSAKKVAWPPHLDHEGINEEYLSQQDPSYQRGQQQDPNYQGINQNQISDNMDQQMMSQQYQQQVSNTQQGYKVLNQSYQMQQYKFEQQSGGYQQTVPITTHHQQQIQQTHKFSQEMPGQQFQIPIQRMEPEITQQARGQSANQHFQIPIQTTSHGGQMPSQQQQFQAQSYVQNQPQGQFQQPQSKFQAQPQIGGVGAQIKAPISNEEMVQEWPPKNDGPNLTTTYPSGFKLKDELTMSQPGAQVVTSQPAFKITQPLKMRGDTKWPPRKAGEEDIIQEEVREFVKPKKQTRDYSEFFAQNALPNNYPGYRAPPGTQHHGGEEEGQEE